MYPPPPWHQHMKIDRCNFRPQSRAIAPMPLDDREQPVPPRDLTALWRWQPRRSLPLRRRKMQMVRLGGKKPRRRMMVLVRLFRKMKLRWLKLQYLCMLRKLKEYYRNLIKDMVEGGATIESYQQRLFMESTFAIPVGFTFSSYPSRHGSDRLRTIYV
ncbi:hypothetical protein L6164_004198 [Bauhinia variegata]|uniref:Uncharacterized protein n=1 Tax=Bauhinia variegata TaxID=167791 RepID=A0ACB9Q3N5_BAUVA|nr:hypothetical protein L6164_004198 [Bauhinia variegata]